MVVNETNAAGEASSQGGGRTPHSLKEEIKQTGDSQAPQKSHGDDTACTRSSEADVGGDDKSDGKAPAEELTTKGNRFVVEKDEDEESPDGEQNSGDEADFARNGESDCTIRAKDSQTSPDAEETTVMFQRDGGEECRIGNEQRGDNETDFAGTCESPTVAKDLRTTGPVSPDSPDISQLTLAKCAVAAMADFRNMSSGKKSKKNFIKDVEDAHEIDVESCEGDEAKAGRVEKRKETLLQTSRTLSNVVMESIKKIPDGIDDAYDKAETEAKSLLSGKAEAENDRLEKKKLLMTPPRLSDIIRQRKKDEAESPESHPSCQGEEEKMEVKHAKGSSLKIPALPIISRRQTTECAHQFEEHTYGAPTYCKVCDGLLVGLWSQGFQCKACGMNVHRGQGLGDHDDCRAEALLTSCPGLSLDVVSAHEPKVKLGEAIKQVHQLAKTSPNFLKDVGEQLDRDIKAIAKEAIVAGSVEEERSKNLRRIKAWVVPFVQSTDDIASHGEVYAFLFLLFIQALATLTVTAISLIAFIIALWPRHGLLTDTSIRLAAVHDATVTAALHTIGAVFALVLHRLACIFKRRVNVYDRFLRDVFQIDAEADIGISVAGAAGRAQAWSKRVLIASVISCIVASLLWHAMQPASWEAATLPPHAGVFVPAVAVLVCACVLALVPYRRAPVVPSSPSPIAEDDLLPKKAATLISSSPEVGKDVTCKQAKK